MAAQEEYVVYKNAQTTYNVDFHPGNSYLWEVVTGFNPLVDATSNDYSFVSESTSDTVVIKWKSVGSYYLKLTETDAQGCVNSKVLAVTVLSDNRSIGFENTADAVCFNESDNSFVQRLSAINSAGAPLEEEFYPLNIEFTVNGNSHSQQLEFNDQSLAIPDDWFNERADQITDVVVRLTNVTDSNGDPVQLTGGKTKFTQTIMAVPVVQFDAGIPDTIELNTVYSFKAFSNSDNIYEWWYTNENGTRFNFTSTTNSTEQHFWNTKGKYTLFVMVRDTVGCSSEIISKPFVVTETVDYWANATAGRDTVIGACNPYTLQGWTSKNLQLSYSWEPAELLDNPHSPHPVFVPGETTIFTLYVSDNNGRSDLYSVKVTVSEARANAGEDVFMYNNTPVALDGTASSGTNLNYHWTTRDGNIISGGRTANPVVSKPGEYYLGVIDRFGCTSVDSVNVGFVSQAPVAQDDYDTTAFETEVKIRVLDNDFDQENDIDSLSLNIKNPPYRGTAYVDYADYSIHYRPNTGFSGNDSFEYEICDTHSNCSDAKVYVMVSDSKFFIPDAFSPNGDGINDYFEIVGIQWYEGNSIEIFNRWGNKVYQAKNYGISTSPQFWNGKSNTGVRLGNEELPTGTYFYILDLGNGEKRIAGSVYLDR